MKNYKFRLSALISSKWFHKLKNMNNPSKNSPPPPPYSLNTTNKRSSSSQSKSLPHSSGSYFSNTSLESKTLQVSLRNSPHMIQSKRKSVYKPSQPSSSAIPAGLHKNKIKFPRNQDSSFSAASNLKLSSSADHIVLDMKSRDFKKKMFRETKVLVSMEKACPASNQTEVTLKSHNRDKEEDACRIQTKPLVSSGRRSSTHSPGIKLRVSSPRVQVSPCISKSRLQSKQALDSFAVIKSSLDPKKDFRESMVEMIQENNIRASKDLEDLLTCYLSLNHKEYHELIIKVFIQVWLEVIKPTFASK